MNSGLFIIFNKNEGNILSPTFMLHTFSKTYNIAEAVAVSGSCLIQETLESFFLIIKN